VTFTQPALKVINLKQDCLLI